MTAREHAEIADDILRGGETNESDWMAAQAHALVAIALALTNHPGLTEERRTPGYDPHRAFGGKP